MFLWLWFNQVNHLVIFAKILRAHNLDLNLRLLLDVKSCGFSFVVCLITSVVVVFSNYYIGEYYKGSVFMSLIRLFVLSILFLINTSDIFFLILGWDGLGLISFILVLYYQNHVRTFSAVITFLVNRFGDCFMLLRIIYLYLCYPFGYPFSVLEVPLIISVILVVGAITKSALFPFSSWLPAAIAAPTPISSLVHSSTLVTAGLYIFIRFYAVFSLELWLGYVIINVGLFTSFYAGLSALFEVDLKKIVALSTLRHLGFICLAIFRGSITLAYLHLLSHALFKSLLFMSVGELIFTGYHYQDSRYLTRVGLQIKHSSLFMLFALFSLLGFPFVRGFYSKDLILEIFIYSSFSWFIYLIVIFNLFFTYYYSLKIYQAVVMYSNTYPFGIMAPRNMFGPVMIVLIGLLGVVFINCFMWFVNPVSIFIIFPIFKMVPFVVISAILLIFFVKFSIVIPIYNSWCTEFFNTILFLTPLITHLNSHFFLRARNSLTKTFESGFIRAVLDTNLVSYSSYVSNLVWLTFTRVNFNIVLVLSTRLFLLLLVI